MGDFSACSSLSVANPRSIVLEDSGRRVDSNSLGELDLRVLPVYQSMIPLTENVEGTTPHQRLCWEDFAISPTPPSRLGSACMVRLHFISGSDLCWTFANTISRMTGHSRLATRRTIQSNKYGNDVSFLMDMDEGYRWIRSGIPYHTVDSLFVS
jgi:hypothetical protein